MRDQEFHIFGTYIKDYVKITKGSCYELSYEKNYAEPVIRCHTSVRPHSHPGKKKLILSSKIPLKQERSFRINKRYMFSFPIYPNSAYNFF